MPTTDGISRIAPSVGADRRRQIGQCLIASVLFALALGLFLVFRRASGALAAPLPPTQLVITATILVAWATVVRVFASQTVGRFAVWLPLVALVLFAVGCSYPGGRIVDWLVWPAVVAVLAWFPARPLLARGSSPAITTEPRNDQLLQQLTRFRTANGHEAIHGVLVAEFAPRERSATLHVGFCPPFERLPQVEAESVDNPAANVKVVQVLHNGAQVDVRLPVPAAMQITVSVEVFAAEPESP